MFDAERRKFDENTMTTKTKVQRKTVREKVESETGRLQDLRELKKRVQLFNEQLHRAKEVFQETQEDLKRLQSRADRKCEIVRMESARQGQILMKLAELERTVNPKRDLEESNSTPSKDDVMPEAARRAARSCSTAYKIGRYVKIGCVMILDSVAAYALFKITKPFFF